jgi:DNA-binding SARP family transcriptional activator/outer membrane protein assembly factor BamB
VEVRILGPVEVVADGQPLELHAGTEQALLALLALHAGEPLAAERVIDAIWGDEPPPSAREMVRLYVGRLRRLLGEDAIKRAGGGYALNERRDAIDLFRFEQLRRDGRRADETGDHEAAARLLGEALAIWRGAAFGGVERAAFVDHEARRLEELRVATVEERFDAEIALGRGPPLAPEIERVAAEHPYRERLQGQLMLALYQAGRQAEALEHYRVVRKRLVDELGIEPGAELQRMQQAILQQDPTLAPPAPAVPDEAARVLARKRRRFVLVAAVLVLGVSATTVAAWLGNHSTSPLRAFASNSLGEIDAVSGALVAQAAIGGVPGPIAIGRDRVWVADGEHRLLYALDPSTLRRRKTFGLPEPAYALAAGAGSIWIGNGFDGTLTRIDSTGFVSPPFRAEPRSRGRLAVAYGASAVWVGSQDNVVTRVDARDGTTIARIRGIANPVAIAATPSGVWVAQATRAALVRIDPTENRVTRTIPLGSFASSVAIGRGSVWAVTPDDGHLWRIDQTSNAVMAGITIASQASAVVVAGGQVWVASTSTGTLYRIDPRANRIVQTLELAHPIGTLAASRDHLWVSVR